MTLHLRPTAVLAMLLLAIGLLAVAGGIAGGVRHLSPATGWKAESLQLFDLSCENNVPTWFSSVLLLAGATLAFLLGAGVTRRRARWWLLAAVLVAVSLTEDASLFERGLDLFAHLQTVGVPFDAWRWLAVAGAAGLAVFFAPLVVTMTPRRALFAIGAVALFTIGHWALAWLGGWIGFTQGHNVPAFVWARVGEETSKMLGEALGVVALTAELRGRGGLRLWIG